MLYRTIKHIQYLYTAYNYTVHRHTKLHKQLLKLNRSRTKVGVTKYLQKPLENNELENFAALYCSAAQ